MLLVREPTPLTMDTSVDNKSLTDQPSSSKVVILVSYLEHKYVKT